MDSKSPSQKGKDHLVAALGHGPRAGLRIPLAEPVIPGVVKLVFTDGYEGVVDLRQAGLLKVKAGLTSLEEVEAVTNLFI